MSELDTIRKVAQQALGVSDQGGTTDNYLWDRAQRIVRNVEQICRLPELAVNDLQIDRFCLLSAAYFADGRLGACEPGSTDANAADFRDLGTQLVNEKLAGIVTDARISKINKIIIESDNRLTKMTEAVILSDGRSLEDLGLVGIFNEIRRCVIQGKGLCRILKSWKQKIDYRYWDARLKEGFRLDSVRKIAAQRFSSAEYFMNRLAIENSGGDLEEVISETADDKK